MSTIQYLKNLFTDRNVASVTPTSAFGVNRILSKMDFGRARLIVEYGPGGGVFTERLLERMAPHARLIAIEANGDFAQALRTRLHDPRLTIVHGSAENVLEILQEHGLTHADYILSGIPFSLFPVPLKDKILAATREALASDGRFFVYQFLISWSSPKHDIKKKLDEHMEIVRSDYELRCIPPLRIYEVSPNKLDERAASFQ